MSYRNHTAKSIIFDIADNYGDGTYIGFRSIEFKYNGFVIPMLYSTDFLSYETSSAGTSYLARHAFATDILKTGSSTNTSFMSSGGQNTNQRIIIVFNTIQKFDEVIINNYHHSGAATNRGSKNIVITTSTDTITDTTYEGSIANSFVIFNNIIDEHIVSDSQDDQILILNYSWLTGWKKRRKLTIDKDKIDSDLTHFPVPILLSHGAGQAEITNVDDNFNGIDGDVPNKSFWKNSGDDNAVINSNKLRFSVVGGSTAYDYCTIDSVFQMGGTGDFSIDFDSIPITQPATDSSYFYLKIVNVADDADFCYFSRYRSSTQLQFRSGQVIDGASVGSATTSTAVSFSKWRVTRESGDIKFWYYDTVWNLYHTVSGTTYPEFTNEIYLKFQLFSYVGFPALTWDIDSFVVNSGTIVWPAGEGGKDNTNIFKELEYKGGVDDDFTGIDDDSPNSDLWGMYYDSQDSGDSSGVISIQSNKLNFLLGAITMPVVNSIYLLSGDFDIQVDFTKVGTPSPDSGWAHAFVLGQANVSVFGDSKRAYISRFPPPDGEYRAQTYNTSATQGGSADSSGKYRFVRSGLSLDMDYWNGSSWTTLQTDASYGDHDVYCKMFGRVWSVAKTLNIDFDNFVINSGNIKWPNNTHPNRKKMAITEDNGTELYGELEQFEPEEEKAVIWVSKHDLVLSSSIDTDLYLYFDSEHDDNPMIGNTGEWNETTDLITGDDFTGDNDDLPNPDLWSVAYTDHLTTSFAADIQSNKLKESFTGVNSAGGDSVKIKSTFRLSGDFDIQVDFDSLIHQNHNAAGFSLGVGQENGYHSFIKAAYSSGNKWLLRTNDGSSSESTPSRTNDYGKMRLVRSGSSLSLYITDGGGSESLGHSGTVGSNDMSITFDGYDWQSGSVISINFDNFIINSGTVLINPSQHVWDDDFKAVYHMAQDPDGDVANSILDSTLNGNHGTPNGTMLSEDLVDGEIGKAIDFDGTDDGIVIAHNTILNPGGDDFSIIAKIKTSDSLGTIFSKGTSGDNPAYNFFVSTDGKLNVTIEGTGDQSPAGIGVTNVANDVWRVVGVTVNRTDSLFTIYVDGGNDGGTNLDFSGTSVGDIDPTNDALIADFVTAYELTAKIEFIGYCFRLLSASWMKTISYALKDDLLTFEETSYLDYENRVKISIDNSNIDSDLEHFPIPIVLGSSVGQSSQDVTEIFDALVYNNVDDTFTGDNDDLPNPDLWTLSKTGTGATNLSIQDNTLELTATYVDSTDIRITSTFLISGDFDVQVDFNINLNPESYADTNTYLQVLGSSWNGKVRAHYNHSSLKKFSKHSSVNGYGSESTRINNYGKLRITRTGSNIYFYYADGTGSWVLDADSPNPENLGSGHIVVRLGIRNSAATGNTFGSQFDNFVVNSGTIKWPDNVNPNRKRIAITKDDGIDELHGEIEIWDSENEKAVVWVSKRDFDLKSFEDTDLYLYYDPDHIQNKMIGNTGEWNETDLITGDDFTGDNDDLPNPDLWKTEHSFYDSGADSSGTLSIQNNTLSLSVSGAVSSPYAQSKFKLSGDFDIQVDFSMGATPSPDSDWQFGLMVTGEGSQPIGQSDYAYIHRETLSRGPYRGGTNLGVAITGSEDTSGKFRLARTGSSIVCYYWGGSSWITVLTETSFSIDDMYVSLINRMWISGGTLSCNFDNFLINSGTVLINPSQHVWDDDFKAVYHMAQDPSGSAPQLYDSTLNNKDAVSSGTMLAEDLVNGEIGKAIDFDGTDDFFTLPQIFSDGFSEVTIEIQMKVIDTSAEYRIFAYNEEGGFLSITANYGSIVNKIFFRSYDGASAGVESTGYTLTNFNNLTLTSKENDNTVGYVGGINIGSISVGSFIEVGTAGRVLGAARTGAINFTKGIVSSVRVSNVIRSTAWIEVTNYSLKDNLITFVFEAGGVDALIDMALDIKAYQDYAQDIKSDLILAAYTTDDVQMSLAAYLQHISDLKSDLSLYGSILQNTMLDVIVAGEIKEDLKTELAMYFQEMEPLKFDLKTFGEKIDLLPFDLKVAVEIREDGKLDLNSAYVAFENLKQFMVLSQAIIDSDVFLDFAVGDGIIFKDNKMDIDVGDGNKKEDVGLSLTLVAPAPIFKAIYALHLESAVKEII